jgi:hypothetical protein
MGQSTSEGIHLVRKDDLRNAEEALINWALFLVLIFL